MRLVELSNSVLVCFLSLLLSLLHESLFISSSFLYSPYTFLRVSSLKWLGWGNLHWPLDIDCQNPSTPSPSPGKRHDMPTMAMSPV